MAGYQRIVSYLYEYVHGEKRENVGYAKLEIREQAAKMILSIRLRRPVQGGCPVNFYYREGRQAYRIATGGQIELSGGRGEERLLLPGSMAGLSGIQVGQMNGILIELPDGYIGSAWDDQGFPLPEECPDYETRVRAAVESVETWGGEAGKAELYAASADRMEEGSLPVSGALEGDGQEAAEGRKYGTEGQKGRGERQEEKGERQKGRGEGQEERGERQKGRGEGQEEGREGQKGRGERQEERREGQKDRGERQEERGEDHKGRGEGREEGRERWVEQAGEGQREGTRKAEKQELGGRQLPPDRSQEGRRRRSPQNWMPHGSTGEEGMKREWRIEIQPVEPEKAGAAAGELETQGAAREKRVEEGSHKEGVRTKNGAPASTGEGQRAEAERLTESEANQEMHPNPGADHIFGIHTESGRIQGQVSQGQNHQGQGYQGQNLQEQGSQDQVSQNQRRTEQRRQPIPGLGRQVEKSEESAAAPPYPGQRVQRPQPSFRRRAKQQRQPHATQETATGQDMVEYFLQNGARMCPFEDGEITSCVRIEPSDLEYFPKETWILGSNSFLLHGYYTYGHLILARKKGMGKESLILGVPGVYQNRERFLARMFGFEHFKPIAKEGTADGGFGYWYLFLPEVI